MAAKEVRPMGVEAGGAQSGRLAEDGLYPLIALGTIVN